MRLKKNSLKITSLVFAFLGFAMIGAVIFPIVSYNLASARFSRFLSPVPDNFDSTKASQWFAGAAPQLDKSSVKYYTISIPKLKIADATVAINGDDLSEFLVQYTGTALPGKVGNAVVFGHSVLPQFFNPRDYLTIFSTLPTLSKGDAIHVEYDGVSYKYQVSEMFEVSPSSLDVLRQDTQGKFLSLITCVPPGDPRRPRRLVVRASLVPTLGAL